ncbi:MAG: TolC family protein [Thermodesulfobacteriota bacterium]
MSSRARIAGMLIMLLVLTAGAAAAQEPAGPPELTLEEAISLALKFSPEVKASQSEVDVAKAQKDEVHGYRLPQFDITGVGGPAPDVDKPEIRGDGIYWPDTKHDLHGLTIFGRLEMALVQPLYTFGKIVYRERAAENYVQVKRAEMDTKRAEVILQVAEAYYGLVLAQQGKDAVQEAGDYLSDARERVDRLLALQSPSVKDTDPYRLALYEGGLEKFAAQVEEGSKVAYRALKALIGYKPDQEFRVPLELPEPSPAPLKLDFYLKQALELRPEFDMLKHGKAARELLVKGAKADFYPDLFFAIVGTLAGSPDRYSDPDPIHEDLTNWYGIGPVVGVRWHFDFGITKAKLNKARAELEKLQHQERQALMGIPIEVARAYGKVQENYKGSQGMGKAYVNARRWLITAFSNFDMGLGKMEDIFQAFERYGVARGDYLMALFDYNLAVTKLDKATGAYRLAQPGRELPPEKKPGEVKPPAG